MILKIFPLDDIKEENTLVLHEGEHIIGRGFLNCHDKRVSRKHAVITVCKDLVTIKAVHINPCFFKSAKGTSITIIPKDTSVVLSDGDQFALLASNYWFKLKILNDEDGESTNVLQGEPTNNVPLDNQTSGNQSENFGKSKSFNNVPSTSKRSNTEGSSVKVAKRQKICSEDIDTRNITELNSSTNDETVMKTDHGGHQSFAENIDAHKLINNLRAIFEEDYGDKSDKQRKNEKDGSTCEENKNIVNVKTEMDEIPVESNSNQNKEMLQNVESTSAEKSDSEQSKGNQESKDGVIPNENDSRTEIKTDIDENQNNTAQGSTSIIENDGETSDNANKIEHKDGSNETSNENKASCSTDNGNRNLRRERCWYGPSCYRKNPVHRVDFSHPGDDDYLTDPEDDRPVCPFGVICYRKNLLHRRTYKHPNPPAPKPSKVNFQVNVNTCCPFCSHCNRKKSRKENYESDHESDYD